MVIKHKLMLQDPLATHGAEESALIERLLGNHEIDEALAVSALA